MYMNEKLSNPLWIHLQISMSALTGHYALALTSCVSICQEPTDVHAEMVIMMLMDYVKVTNTLFYYVCVWVFVCMYSYMHARMCAYVCMLCVHVCVCVHV